MWWSLAMDVSSIVSEDQHEKHVQRDKRAQQCGAENAAGCARLLSNTYSGKSCNPIFGLGLFQRTIQSGRCRYDGRIHILPS